MATGTVAQESFYRSLGVNMKIRRNKNLLAQVLAGVWIAGMGIAEAFATPIVFEYSTAQQIDRDYYYRYERPKYAVDGQYNLDGESTIIGLGGRINDHTNLANALFQVKIISGGSSVSLSGIVPSINSCAGDQYTNCLWFADPSSTYRLNIKEDLLNGNTLVEFNYYLNRSVYSNAGGSYSYYDGLEVVTGDFAYHLDFGNDILFSMAITATDGEIYKGAGYSDLPDYLYVDNKPWTCNTANTLCEEYSESQTGKRFSGVPTNIDISSVPEPTALSLVGLGLLGLGWSRTRRAG